MILHNKNNEDKWFYWSKKSMKHYYPNKDYRVRGPTKWNLEHNLKIGTSIIGATIIGSWEDGEED